MRLFSEIRRALSQEESLSSIEYTVVAGGGGYFQNVRKLLEFSGERIVLKGRSGGVAVEGRGLSLGKYFAGDLVVRGEILKVERIS